MVTGATGGMLGGLAAAPTAAVSGPAGPATGALAGAGAGGLLGRYTQYLLQRTLGGTKAGDFLGVPALRRDESAGRVLGQAGREATAQMTMEAGGQILAAPLGFVRRGGFVSDPVTRGIAAADQRMGTKLSAAEIAGNTLPGKVGKTIQSYAAGAFGGGPMQEAVRKEGTANALRQIDAALAVLGGPGTRTEAGRAAEAGLGAAKAGQSVRGEAIEAAVAAAPPVNMEPIKQAAVTEIERSIAPRIATFPDVVNNPKIAQLVRQVRADPQLIQRLPRPAVLTLVDTILERTNSPSLRMLREILGSEDQSPFRGVWEQSKVLRRGATPDEQLYAKGDAQRLATRFSGLFRDAMSEASPAFAQAASDYRVHAKVLESRAVEKILKTAVAQPEAVVGLIKNNPTRARQLQRALKAVAAPGPDKARAAAAYDLIRSTYLQQEVVQGGKPMPTTEEGFNKMLTTLSDRMNAAKQSGVIPQWFGDQNGQRVIAHVEQIAALMKQRSPVMAGNLRKIFEIGRLITGGLQFAGSIAAGKAPATSAIQAAALWEGFPDFFIWMVHNPKATRWFIQGVQAPNPTVSSAAVIRLMESYRRAHEAQQPSQQPPRTTPPTPETQP